MKRHACGFLLMLWLIGQSLFSFAQPGCFTFEDILKLHRGDFSEIQQQFNSSEWFFKAAETDVRPLGFRSVFSVDYIQWLRYGSSIQESVELYPLVGKSNFVRLVTSPDCFRKITSGLSTSHTSRSKILDNALQTSYTIGYTRVDLLTVKQEINESIFIIMLYDTSVFQFEEVTDVSRIGDPFDPAKASAESPTLNQSTSIKKGYAGSPGKITGGESPTVGAKRTMPSDFERKGDPRSFYPGKKNTGGAPNGSQPGSGGGGQGTASGDGNGSGSGGGSGSGSGGGNGPGVGVGFDLAERDMRSKPRVEDNSQEQGRIVIEVLVDKNGVVLQADGPIRGTTLSNDSMIRKCKEASMKARFSPSPSGLEVQRGTITYNFILR